MHIRTLCHLLAACTCVAVGQASAQITPWVAHWRLDETTGTTARDSSPQLNHGTLKNFTGTPWGAGKRRNALTFDGVDDYVEVKVRRGLPIYDGKGSAYSVAFWVKAPAQNDKRVYSEGNGQSATNSGALFTIGSGRSSNGTTGKLQIYIRDDKKNGELNWQSNTTVFDDKWHHVAWVDAAGKGALYIDGVKDTRNWDYTTTGKSPTSPTYGTFTMDKVSLGAVLRRNAVAFLKGTLDDVRVYRFALSAADVKRVMQTVAHPQCSASIGKYGYGCGTGPLDIRGTGSAQFGKTLNLQLTKGRPGAIALLLMSFGPAGTVDLTAAGFQGCRLYPSLTFLQTFGIGIINSQGASATQRLPIPNLTGLACQRLTFQGMTLGGTPVTADFSGASLAQLGK